MFEPHLVGNNDSGQYTRNGVGVEVWPVRVQFKEREQYQGGYLPADDSDNVRVCSNHPVAAEREFMWCYRIKLRPAVSTSSQFTKQ